MDYLQVKAIHIIFVTSWFAGLFYFPRLLVYHVEAHAKGGQEGAILSKALHGYQKLLIRAIMYPAMILTWVSGISMVYINSDLLEAKWLHFKLAFVVACTIYHIACQWLMSKMKQNIYPLSSIQLRLYNEVATILFVAIVFLVVLKNTVDWLYGLAGLVLFSLIILGAVKIVKKLRK